jgi:hypothetical protein
MTAHGTEPNTEPLLFPDPVIEAYIKDVDRTILRENLRHSVEWRLENFAAFMRGVYDLRREVERNGMR